MNEFIYKEKTLGKNCLKCWQVAFPNLTLRIRAFKLISMSRRMSRMSNSPLLEENGTTLDICVEASKLHSVSHQRRKRPTVEFRSSDRKHLQFLENGYPKESSLFSNRTPMKRCPRIPILQNANIYNYFAPLWILQVFIILLTRIKRAEAKISIRLVQ